MHWKKTLLQLILVVLMAGGRLEGQDSCRPVDPYDSGGPLDPDEAVYDAGFYDLRIRVNPADSTVEGRLDLYARVVAPAWRIAFDLDPLLAVHEVRFVDGETELPFVRCGGRARVRLPRTLQPGDRLALRVTYGGHPRVAPRPPWDGGFQWARTPSGAPWIATSNQMLGADVWWPVKDHVSDKPDSMAISVTVPGSLVVASNGRLRSVSAAADGWKTWNWFVSTPISTYNVALNIAPYRTIDTTVASVAGDSIPVVFYVLGEDHAKGVALFPEILAHLAWFERRIGPYPFRRDKYGVAQTPHLGMEHQSIIAYGANFDNRAMTGVDWGFDALHQHELSHEWWGNLVTNADWKDMWIHEGFGTYMQALWLEDTQGGERARAFLRSVESNIANRDPIAPRETTSSRGIYGGDIYFKGARVLHTLRWLIGDEAFFRAVRRLAYPDDAAARSTDGSAVHFATTDDFIAIAEQESGRELGWFFDVYVFQAALPTLVSAQIGDQLTLHWEVPGGLPFPMPVEIVVSEERRRLALPDGRVSVRLAPGAEVVVDPDWWVLRAR